MKTIITPKDIENFRWMVEHKYIPYQKIPDAPGKSFEEIRELGKLYFPHSEYAFELALAVYDWTTADFARIQYLNLFTYTGISMLDSNIFDFENIARAIWTSNWPPYTPADEYYMNAFMMKPASSLNDVKSQLRANLRILDNMNISECAILNNAIMVMPKTLSTDVPKLFSGQVDMNNLGAKYFAAYFNEHPANNDALYPPIEMDLNDALHSFLSIGNVVTLKTYMSFADTYDIAYKYNNGILLTILPSEGNMQWQSCAYITPLSNDPNKNEYLFMPGTRFKIESILYDELVRMTLRVI